MLNLSRFTRFSWGKILKERFALCKEIDISQLCIYYQIADTQKIYEYIILLQLKLFQDSQLLQNFGGQSYVRARQDFCGKMWGWHFCYIWEAWNVSFYWDPPRTPPYNATFCHIWPENITSHPSSTKTPPQDSDLKFTTSLTGSSPSGPLQALLPWPPFSFDSLTRGVHKVF